MTATRTGTRLGGRYRLTERLAFGGMGEVWAGVDEVLGRAVAVKILRPELARDDAFRRRFREEARTAGGLSHPGIAAVYDYGEGPPAQPPGSYEPGGNQPEADDGDGTAYPGATGYNQHEPDWTSGNDVAYLVMELVPGKPLSAILSESGPLPPVRALELVAQTGRALHAAHQRGIVHRDVKPANLMVTPEGRVKVTDFGIARPQDHEPLTATGQVMGTAHYLAPELARGHLATALSDVYALGVVAYECVAGRRPFEGDNQVAVATAHLSEEPPPLPGALPADVRRVITTAMQKEPDFRFSNADAFAEVLDFVRFRILANDPLPVWASQGPVPGVGPNNLQAPDNTSHPPVTAAETERFFAEIGATRINSPLQASPLTPETQGRSDTAALPVGRPVNRFGMNGTQPPGKRSMRIPILAGIGALVLIIGLIFMFSWFGNHQDPTPRNMPPSTMKQPLNTESAAPTPTTDELSTYRTPYTGNHRQATASPSYTRTYWRTWRTTTEPFTPLEPTPPEPTPPEPTPSSTPTIVTSTTPTASQ